MKRTVWAALSAKQRQSYADPKRQCIEKGCTKPAGTPWGPYWCADCDDARMRRIWSQLRELLQKDEVEKTDEC